MTDCIQLSDGDKFICKLCGWSYHKRVHRNCPKSPEGRAGMLIAVLHQITTKYESTVNWQMYPLRPLDELEKNLETCLDCDEHNGNTCTQRGMDCRARWLKRLACMGFRDCSRWQ
jgi:hypothetical protein